MFEHSGQASPISEGVAEIQINIHIANEITWEHHICEPRRHYEWPPFTMTTKESGQVLPRPSEVRYSISATVDPTNPICTST
jgi:hypothetical protein